MNTRTFATVPGAAFILATGGGAIMSATAYAQMVAVAYGLLVVLGLLPATNTTFGYIPIYGNDVWLHAAIAIAAGIFGFGRPTATMPVRR